MRGDERQMKGGVLSVRGIELPVKGGELREEELPVRQGVLSVRGENFW